MLTAPRSRLVVPPATRKGGVYVPPAANPLVTNLTAFLPLGGYPGKPRPPAVGAAWAADIRGTVTTAAGSLGPRAVFDGSSALGLPYGDDSTLNLSGDVDLTMRVRFRMPTLPADGTSASVLHVGPVGGNLIFDLYVTTSAPRTYLQLEARTAAGTQFFVTAYNYTGVGTLTLSANTWYTAVLRRNQTTGTWTLYVVELPEFSGHANNTTTAAGIRPYVSNSINDNLRVGGRYDYLTDAWDRPFAGDVEGLYVWRGYRASDAEVATMGQGFDPTGRYSSLRLDLSEPQAFQVLQRDGSSQATLRISGSLGGPAQTLTDLQYSWNGSAFADMTATVDDTARTFTGTATITPAAATPAGRQGMLYVRLKNNTAVQAAVAYVGIGDVFAVGGQSNAAGAYTNAQPYAPSNGLKGGLYHPSYAIREMADPTHRADCNWIDSSTESASAGSVWTRFAALWADRTGYPCMIVACARSGAVIGANNSVSGYAGWSPTAGVYRFQVLDLYHALTRRIGQLPGGVKACLMMEGESNASLGTSSGTYSTELQAFADALAAAAGGVKTVCSLLPSGLTGATAINDGIAAADAADANVQTGPDLTGVPYDASPHWNTDAKATTIAAAWDSTLAALGYAA